MHAPMKRALSPARSMLALAAVLLAGGCSSPRSECVPFARMPSRAARPPESIALFKSGQKPSCDYEVVARVVGQGGNFTFGNAVATEQLREAIASRGLDGGIDYLCARQGTADSALGSCSARAYFCR